MKKSTLISLLTITAVAVVIAVILNLTFSLPTHQIPIVYGTIAGIALITAIGTTVITGKRKTINTAK